MKDEDLNLERIEYLKKELEEIDKEKSMHFRKVREEGMSDNEEWEYYKKNVHPLHDRTRYIEDLIRRIENYNVKEGDGVTVCLYSDRHACTVIKRTAKTITVQRDKAILDKNFKPEFDGFHCLNDDEQSYEYERDEQGSVETYRWSDKYGSFRGGDDQSIRIINGRHEHYDYNF